MTDSHQIAETQVALGIKIGFESISNGRVLHPHYHGETPSLDAHFKVLRHIH